MSTAILVLTPRRPCPRSPPARALAEEVVIFGPHASWAIAVGRLPPVLKRLLQTPRFRSSPRRSLPSSAGRGPLRLVFPTIWQSHDAIVAVMALGIVVRLAGPLARDKRRDPAVVVVDDAGRFAISVLGGHGVRANELAIRVGTVLGAQPVVTTASEARGLPAVDQVGRDQGWTIERTENLTRVAAAVVRRAGRRLAGCWISRLVATVRPLAELISTGLVPGTSCRGCMPRPCSSSVTGSNLRTSRSSRRPVYRPPTLIAGIGCRRGTSLETIAGWTHSVLRASRPGGGEPRGVGHGDLEGR